MPTRHGQLFGAVCLILFVLFKSCHVVYTKELFTNSFLVKFRQGVDNNLAHNVANRNGFVNLGPVSKLLFFV